MRPATWITGSPKRRSEALPHVSAFANRASARAPHIGWLPERSQSPELRASIRRAADGIVSPAPELRLAPPPRSLDFLEELEPDLEQVRTPFTRRHSQSLPWWARIAMPARIAQHELVAAAGLPLAWLGRR